MRKDTSKRSPQQGLQLLQKTFYPKMLSSISQKYYVLIETLKSFYLIEIFFFLNTLLKRSCSPAKYASLGQRKSGIAGLVQK